MKRIVIVTSNLSDIFNGGAAYGGGYVVTKNLISQLLQRDDIELTILSEKNTNVDLQNVKTIEIKCNIYNCNFEKEVIKFLENNKFDMIISANTYHIFPNYLLQCHSFVHRAKNIFPLFRPIKTFFSRKKIKLQNELLKKRDKNNKFIAVSETIKQDYSKNFNIKPENILVVHPACNQVFTAIPEIHKNNVPTFGIVANSSINKGGHYFLFALGIAKLFGLKFNLKIIAPKYKKDILLRALVNIFFMKKQVEVLPMQNDMSYFYSGIDFLVMPSLNEAFGLVALEAMSYAKVPLVSSTAGVCDIIKSENGLIFNRNSFVDFIKTILKAGKIYDNDFQQYKTIAANAFNTSKNYTWENFALNIINKA